MSNSYKGLGDALANFWSAIKAADENYKNGAIPPSGISLREHVWDKPEGWKGA